jgi:hypothetical protein
MNFLKDIGWDGRRSIDWPVAILGAVFVTLSSILVVVVLLDIFVWGPAREAACHSKGWDYASQSQMIGRFFRTWHYCVDENGFIREIPRS